jgi:hypothetical protein
MVFDDRPTNRQPQAESDPDTALHLDVFDPVKAFPDALLFPDGDSGHFVPNRNPRLLAFDRQVHRNGAISGRIFESIGQIVGQGLPQPKGINTDEHLPLPWGDEPDRAFRVDLAVLLNRFVDTADQIYQLQVEFQLACPHARDIQEIVHQSV